ncbi:helix-turn-helix domain-containing protein [Aquimarina sp. U1-2]|uniref:helix-turn-helix domain-containing protein n=1 Tax=Aquimarina sp. U1-2 TaxID=2823141 RepID=UPI001FEFEA49|nr:helix-turn-helix domain-containing protein [Aquimarina sp. U1-2]
MKSALYCSFLVYFHWLYYFWYKKSNIMHFQDIIDAIKTRREMLQVNQKTLADLSGVSLRTLKQFESGKGNPTLQTLGKLADALGLELTLQVKQLETDE